MFKKKFPAAAADEYGAERQLRPANIKNGRAALLRSLFLPFLRALRVLRVRKVPCTWPTVALFFSLLFIVGCRTLPPLPQADLSQSGWTVFAGQALWKPNLEAPEIAGELLVATNQNGAAFVQFSKTPFPLMIAQTASNSWQIEAPVENRRFARKGTPPDRVMWFHLPRALAGNNLTPPWRWTSLGESWRLENSKSGERLEGFVEVQPNAGKP